MDAERAIFIAVQNQALRFLCGPDESREFTTLEYIEAMHMACDAHPRFELPIPSDIAASQLSNSDSVVRTGGDKWMAIKPEW